MFGMVSSRANIGMSLFQQSTVLMSHPRDLVLNSHPGTMQIHSLFFVLLDIVIFSLMIQFPCTVRMDESWGVTALTTQLCVEWLIHGGCTHMLGTQLGCRTIVTTGSAKDR
jgi:hypothetical protein